MTQLITPHDFYQVNLMRFFISAEYKKQPNIFIPKALQQYSLFTQQAYGQQLQNQPSAPYQSPEGMTSL